jgi:hypothetical protein
MTPTCQWFALCTRPAAGVAEHPVLDYVPICQPCADNMGVEVLDAEWVID